MSKEARMAEADRRMKADRYAAGFLRSRLGEGRLHYIDYDCALQRRGGDAIFEKKDEPNTPAVIDFKSPTQFLEFTNDHRGDEAPLPMNLSIRSDETGMYAAMFQDGYLAEWVLVHWFASPHEVAAHALIPARKLIDLIHNNSELLRLAGCADWQWIGRGNGEYLAIRDLWKFCRAWGITEITTTTYGEPVPISGAFLPERGDPVQLKIDWN